MSLVNRKGGSGGVSSTEIDERINTLVPPLVSIANTSLARVEDIPPSAEVNTTWRVHAAVDGAGNPKPSDDGTWRKDATLGLILEEPAAGNSQPVGSTITISEIDGQIVGTRQDGSIVSFNT